MGCTSSSLHRHCSFDTSDPNARITDKPPSSTVDYGKYSMDDDQESVCSSVDTAIPPLDMSTSHRMMIVGDSMTQGQEGDFSWRYRLWQWLRSTPGPSIQFVGPFKGTQAQREPRPPQPPSIIGEPDFDPGPSMDGAYAKDVDPAFLDQSHHFSKWGYPAWQAKDAILEQVTTHQPDYLLVALGFNDMGWGFSDAVGTLVSITEIVAKARLAKHNIRIVLGTVPQRLHSDDNDDLAKKTRDYNAKLRHFVRTMNSSASPIKLAEFQQHYSCGKNNTEAAYDGLHPNAFGEVQIAKAYSEPLQAFGLRAPADSLHVPENVCEPALNNILALTATGSPMGVRVTWSPVFGARNYEIRHRVKDSGQGWETANADSPRFDTVFTAAGVHWEYLVRPSRGVAEQFKGNWTSVVDAVARQAGPPAPIDIRIQPTASGCDATWAAPSPPPADLECYQLIVLDRNIPGAFWGGGGARGTAVSLNNLVPHHCFNVWMRTWAVTEGEIAAGPMNEARPFRTGSGEPSSPSGLRCEIKGHASVQLDWISVEDAAAYIVKKRRSELGAQWEQVDEYIYLPTKDVDELRPDAGRYEFCVIAVNGDLESAPSIVRLR